MMTRRKLFAGGLVAGLAGAVIPPREAEAAVDQSDSAVNALRSVLEDIRKDLRSQFSCSPTICQEVDMIRQEQRRFLKGSGKFPDFIDVGIDIWERLCDWHVKNQQRQTVSRMGDGRYAMTFGVTMLVLRPEMGGNYMGLGYDSK
ncbi:MAG: hypothetical protein IMZ55_16575 [Acidobacteria bacterium]|nr:hypothetical protein [Acidobacteriota bacterium]